MKHGPLLIGTVAVLGLAAMLCYEHPSPGPLSSPHGTASASLSTCASCHTEAGLDAGCLGCHAEIAAQLTSEQGYHHEVAGDGPPQCARCHPEHHGPSFDVMEAVAWRPDSRDEFRHGHVAFAICEAHADLACEACHKNTFQMPGYAHKPRRKTYLGLSQDCGTCHENVHGSAELADCARCHGQTVFKPARGFDHDEHFPLIGGHAPLACKECHTSKGGLSFDEVRGTRCADCHENPHHTPWAESCETCHRPDEPAWRSGADHVTAALHAATGFPLTRPHGELGCETCHAAEGPYAKRYVSPPRAGKRCDACHADVHGGQFEGRFAACVDCHAQTHFQPSTFGADRHHAFPLRGAHGSKACAACHEEVDGVRRYIDTPSSCADCHTDVHKGQFVGRSCSSCHNENTFTPSRYRAADHTSFALEGAHASVDCAACHKEVGGATRYVGTPTSCADCHNDVHQGQFKQDCSTCHDQGSFKPVHFGIERHKTFPLRGAHNAVACIACHKRDKAGVRRFVGTARACVACHENPHGGQFASKTSSPSCTDCHEAHSATFSIRPFDHARRTGYVLQGKHATARCNACHRPQKAGGPRHYRGTSTRCDACHTDRHRGQFKGRDCNSCHTSKQRWSLSKFDHSRTGFPLDQRHARVSCAKCHAPVKQRDGSLVVQYRPLGTQCKDCHDFRR